MPDQRISARPVRCLAVLLALACAPAGCHRGTEDAQSDRPERPRGRLVRLVDGEGGPLGSFRIRRRSAIAYDALGVRLGRARVRPDGVEVVDRHARVVLAFRPSSRENGTGEGTGTGPRSADLVGVDGGPVGRVVVDDREAHVVLYGPQGQQRGEVVSIVDERGQATAEVYGAPGTDLLMSARTSSHREITVDDARGSVRSRLLGTRLEPWLAAALHLPSPLEEGDRETALFRAGLLAFLNAGPPAPAR